MRTSIKYLLFVTGLLAACDNTFEELGASNNPPTVKIISGGQELATLDDKLKTSIKHGSDHYTIELIVFDAELGFSSLKGSVVVGEGVFKQNGTETNSFQLSNNRATVEFYPSGSIGEAQLKFIGEDNLGSTGAATVNLEIFSNKPPTAVFSGIELIGVNGREYYFDHASFDQDAANGGGIQALEWSVNGSTFLWKDLTERTKFIFPQAGNFAIRLRVVDNDGAYSEWVDKPTFTIN